MGENDLNLRFFSSILYALRLKASVFVTENLYEDY